MMNQSTNRFQLPSIHRATHRERNSFSPVSQSLRFPRLAWIGLLAGASVLGGWVPGLVATPSAITLASDTVLAQNKPAPVSAEDVSNFVRSALAIEPIRKQAVQEIQAVMSQVPAIRCDSQSSFETLDPRVRGVGIKYCNASKRIVETNGLTVARFNEILMTQRSDAKLRERIQAETCRLEPDVCQGR